MVRSTSCGHFGKPRRKKTNAWWLAIGTRPDCVANDVLDIVVDEFAEKTYVSLELGMQTIHNASLDWMNRGHHHDAAVDAMNRVAGRKFEVSMHIMLGLPGETHEMMMETADQVADWNAAGVKIHNLYAVERTKLADQVRSGEVRMLEVLKNTSKCSPTSSNVCHRKW